MSYSIGQSSPVGIQAETFGAGRMPDAETIKPWLSALSVRSGDVAELLPDRHAINNMQPLMPAKQLRAILGRGIILGSGTILASLLVMVFFRLDISAPPDVR